MHTLDGMHTAVATREDATVIDPAWLIAAMDEQGSGSAALARKLEVDNTTVFRWRKGDSPITRVTWLAALHALGLPADWEPGAAKAKKAKPRA
jgi:hypothetical protein